MNKNIVRLVQIEDEQNHYRKGAKTEILLSVVADTPEGMKSELSLPYKKVAATFYMLKKKEIIPPSFAIRKDGEKVWVYHNYEG